MLQFSAASLAFSSAFCSPSVVGTTLWPCLMTTPPLCPLSLWWCLRLSVWLGCMEQTGEAFFFFSDWVTFLVSFRSWVPCKYQLLSQENKLLPVSFRFLDDVEVMLGWRPSVIYKYLWKYICLLAMLGLLGATTIRMFIKYPTYMAWNQEKVWRLYTV